VASYCCASPLRNDARRRDDREMDNELDLLERLLHRELEKEARNEIDTEAEERRDINPDEEDIDMYLRPKRQEAHPNPTKFLEQFGYLPVMKEGVQHDQASRSGAIRRFQKMYHIQETGQLDPPTMKMMIAPRCGMPDMVPEAYMEESMANNNSPHALKQELKANNFYVPGYKWPKLDLTWHITNYSATTSLSKATQHSALEKALQFWADASALTFTETSGKGDVNIMFVKQKHGDGAQNAFDGPSGVLAHAFYPQSGEGHFDDEENWTDGENGGINLMIVAAHELGHAMGLGHSDAPGALMAPYYQGFIPNFKLPKDDTDAIQTLYGKPSGSQPKPPVVEPKTTTTTTTTTTLPVVLPTAAIAPPSGKPDTCHVVFKAVTQTHDYRVYVFNGPWMWRMSEYGLDDGFPKLINSMYENAPVDIDAVIFSWKTFYTYMFKGNQIWKYYGFQLDETKTISTAGYPASPRAALAGTDGTICLFKNGKCWTLNEATLDITSAPPRPFTDLLPGSPANFDSMVRLVNDANVYFFKANNYFKYEPTTHAVKTGYPKSKAGPWMGPACGATPYTPK
jgi:matrix metalloproteinase-14 (membrane-inserted)